MFSPSHRKRARAPTRAPTRAATAVAALIAAAVTSVLALLVTPTSPMFADADPKSPPTAPSPPSVTRTDPIPHPSVVISGQVSVGQLAPDFVLDGSAGIPVRLSSLRGGWVLLVFAERKDSIGVLAGAEAALEPRGMRVVGVCNETAHTVEVYAARTRLPLLVLADVTGEVSAMYGLWDPVHSSTLPGLVLIEPRGRVHFALLGRALMADDMERLAIEASGQE